MLSNTAQKAIEAYGGMDLWKNATRIEAEVSAKGLAFTLKRRPFFVNAKIEMETTRPFSKLTPIGTNRTITGVFDGQHVRLENEEDETIAERENPRAFFPFGKRLFRWDDLDMSYFANYAFWNYFTLPKLLMNETIKWTEKTPGFLIAEFPENIPTHNPIQEFIFDTETGLLLQHNYTAEIISKLATAANVVVSHSKNSQGYIFPNKRLVTPRSKSGKPLKMPVLIDITVHSFNLK
jgi:hypothetical protein